MVSKATIAAAVDKAFSAFADFVTPVVFTTSTVSGFNFTTGQPNASTSSATISIIPLSKKQEGDDTPYWEFVARSADLSFSNYNSFVYQAEKYTIEEQEFYEGIVLIKARRG